jgi:hypothetical protein
MNQHTPTHFFISYNKADRIWAEWIAWHLEEAGYTTIIQAWDFRPGMNFVFEMHEAVQQADRTIAVLSTNYLEALYTYPEWQAAFKQEPRGEQGILVPVRIQECTPPGFLGLISYIDLVGLDETAARETLLDGVRQGRHTPQRPRSFPAPSVQPSAPLPSNRASLAHSHPSGMCPMPATPTLPGAKPSCESCTMH